MFVSYTRVSNGACGNDQGSGLSILPYNSVIIGSAVEAWKNQKEGGVQGGCGFG